MSNIAAKKVFIQVETAAEQEEHLRNQRKTLKLLQSGATDKENLAGRPYIDKLSRIKAATSDLALAPTEYAKRKKTETRIAETQTSPEKNNKEITVEELTTDEEPGEVYWQKLAERRRKALEESLQENQCLHERIQGLEEELNISRQMLEEARNLVEVLTEMLSENEAKQEIENEEDVIPDEESEIKEKEEGQYDPDSGKDESFKTP